MNEFCRVLFLTKIYHFSENDNSLLFFFDFESGEKISLLAKSFQKENSKNRIKFKQNSFLKVEYFLYPQSSDHGFLKRGDLLLSPPNHPKVIIFLEFVAQLFNFEEKISQKLLLLLIYLYKNYLIINNYFLFKIIFLIIYLRIKKIEFIFDYCVECRSSDNLISFLMFKGGTICQKCLKNKEQILEPFFLKTIEKLFNFRKLNQIMILSFSPEEERFLSESFNDYFEYELGKKINF